MTIEHDLRAMITSIVRDELARARPANDSDQLTVAAYAARWSISPTTVRAAIRSGRLEHTRIGRAIRIASAAQITRDPAADATARARSMLLRGAR